MRLQDKSLMGSWFSMKIISYILDTLYQTQMEDTHVKTSKGEMVDSN